MASLGDAYELIQQEGIASGSRRIVNYALHTLFGPIKGGLSSRPRVRFVSKLFHPFFNNYFNYKYSDGESIFNKDWDNLIILDSCRYDDFENLNGFEGELLPHISNSVDSVQFINNNILGNQYHDTVYVTANPHVRMIGEDVFHAIIDDPLNNWNEKTQCVRPNSVTESAISASKRYPNKRLIIHYMQPHDPPLGKTAKKIESEMNLAGPSRKRGNKNGLRVMSAVASGIIPEELAHKAYRETLEIVLNELEMLLPELQGKTVITADHGEMFGENPYPIIGKLYEHFNHPRTLELCKVPWFIMQFDERKEVRSETPTSYEVEDAGSEDLETQLEALGYK